MIWAMPSEIKGACLDSNCIVRCSLLAQTCALDSKRYCPLLTPLCVFHSESLFYWEAQQCSPCLR